MLVASLVLLGVAAPGYALSDALGPVLAWSAVRGMGFGIVTVLGSTIVAHLVPRDRRGEAIGVYGLAVAAPMVLLMPGSVAVADGFGYGWAFAVAALPLLGIPFGLALGRRVDGTPSWRRRPRTRPHLTDLDTVRMVLRPTVVLFVVTMAGGAVMTFAPQLGFDGLWAAAALLVLGLSSALVALAGRERGRPPRRRGLRRADAAALRRRRRPLRAGRGARRALAAAWRARWCWHPVRRPAEPHPAHRLRQCVPAPGIPTASAVWNIGFDAGTATGAVVVGAIAAAWSFGSAFGVVLVLLLAVLLVAPRHPPGRTSPVS